MLSTVMYRFNFNRNGMERGSVFVCASIAFAIFIQAHSHPDYDNNDRYVRTEEYNTVSVPDIHIFTVKKHQMECLEETRVEPELVLILKTGKFQANPNNLLKEWVLCTMIKEGLMTPQGVYIYDNAMMRLADEDQEATGMLIDICLSKRAMPAQDIAYKFAKCFYKAKGNKMLITYM